MTDDGFPIVALGAYLLGALAALVFAARALWRWAGRSIR